MKGIIDQDVLDARSLVPQIEAILEYVEQRGPGVFSDSSCEFWTSLLYKFEEIGVPTDEWRGKALARWIRFRWDPNELTEPLLRPGRRFFSLGFPILRLFSSMQWSSVNLVDFTYAQSLPQSAVRQVLSNISSSMSLVNYLLESKIAPNMHLAQSTSLPSKTGFTHQTDLHDILQEKCREVDVLLKLPHETNLQIEEDLGWYTSLSIIRMLLLG